ncbi:MAG: hypothetical protein JW953_24090 [Anaerolineae bacterium]|nr:hypothetical protein [Anaerolineae bacterium]
MQRPLGHTLYLTLSLAQPWLRLGPGWAALAGALSTGQATFNLSTLLSLLGLWLLVDPILGGLWDLSVQQGLWRRIATAQLEPPPAYGFSLPYTQPGSMAGRLALQLRRYQVWWQKSYWPAYGRKFIAFWLATILALLLGLFLAPAIFWLTLLAVCLTILAGQISTDLTTAQRGCLPALVELLLPWSMGLALWSALSPFGLIPAFCFWATYLGGLRMLGQHHRAQMLFFLGQVAAVFWLLGWQLLSGAAILSVLLTAQFIIKTKFNHPADFLQKVQPLLVMGVMAVGLSLASL